MLFTSANFLGFFCLVFLVYWGLPGKRRRLVWLLLASIYFYMSWNPWLVTLILFSASVDYLAAMKMEMMERPWPRRLLLLASICTNLGLLAFFKYVNFFLASAYTIQGWLGGEPAQRLFQVVLPLGISFYTFETISYIADVYRRRARAVRDPLEYALYIMFFPHLVAGPIVRPKDFLPQLRRQHRFNWDRMQLGLQFFFLGLFKKVALADNLVPIVDPVFAAPGLYGSLATWLAVLAYSAQIYLDFSGYSDMAVGLAHMLGYRLPRNFNLPYLAANIADFWRRWHISLSSWLRDYLFIPLGGSRGSRWQTCRNLLATMLLGGLWHGASWTFVAWGGLHGLLLVGHRLLPNWKWRESPAFRPLAILTTFLAVCIGWVFFRAQSFGDAAIILQHMFAPSGSGMVLPVPQVWAVGAILAVLGAGHVLGALGNLGRRERVLPEVVMGAALAGLLLLVLILAPEGGKAFIYFQF
jgi:alginate O-acetyltransferase complex protein AlgI